MIDGFRRLKEVVLCNVGSCHAVLRGDEIVRLVNRVLDREFVHGVHRTKLRVPARVADASVLEEGWVVGQVVLSCAESVLMAADAVRYERHLLIAAGPLLHRLLHVLELLKRLLRSHERSALSVLLSLSSLERLVHLVSL